MNQHHSKEDGMTLIEVLATLAILSFLMVLMFNVFLNGFNYSKKANNTVLLQQEMNIIMTNITKFHETQKYYEIVVDTNPNASSIILLGKNSSGEIINTVDLSNSKYEYSLYDSSGNEDIPLEGITKVDTEKHLFLKLIIRNKNDPDQKYEVKTIISKL